MSDQINNFRGIPGGQFLDRNLLAELASSVAVALIGFAVIPFYLKYLGMEAYGLIGFFATVQALLQLLDLGITPAINREVAGFLAADRRDLARTMLHTLATAYWSVAVFVAFLMYLLAPLVSGHWLQSSGLTQQAVTEAVVLMGIVVAARWPVGIYRGALMGAQRQTVSSGVNILMAILGSVGVVLVLIFVSPTIFAFFTAQAVAGIVSSLVMRTAAWRVFGRSSLVRFDLGSLKRIWKFSTGMSAVAVTGLIFTQIDKVILSKILPLDEFAQYALAWVVVSVMYLLINPVFNIVYPRFSSFVAAKDKRQLIQDYHSYSNRLACFLFPLGMTLCVSSQDLVLLWTGNEGISSNVGSLISLLAIGTALHGVMYMPYALQLAYGNSKLPLYINAILLTIFIPLVIGLVQLFGAIGAALAWVLLHSLYLPLGSFLTHRKLLIGEREKWLTMDIGVPLIITTVVGFLGSFTVLNIPHAPVLRILVAIVLLGFSFLLCAVFSPYLAPRVSVIMERN